MLMIGWTTLKTREDAENLARDLVVDRLAACVQVEGPITSVYLWEDGIEQANEYRLLVKFLPERAADVEARILEEHPYQNPEWVVVRAEAVTEKYLSWAQANSSS